MNEWLRDSWWIILIFKSSDDLTWRIPASEKVEMETNQQTPTQFAITSGLDWIKYMQMKNFASYWSLVMNAAQVQSWCHHYKLATRPSQRKPNCYFINLTQRFFVSLFCIEIKFKAYWPLCGMRKKSQLIGFIELCYDAE